MHAERSEGPTGSGSRAGSDRVVQPVAAAWMLSISIDFLLHGGILARLYVRSTPFLLGAHDAFRRIPLGYLSFLLLTLGLAWAVRCANVRTAAGGLRIGAAGGALVWGALVSGLHSISTAPLDLLAGWWIGQTVELAAAGALLGAAAGGASIRRIWGVVALTIVACLIVTVVLQSLGWAPQVTL